VFLNIGLNTCYRLGMGKFWRTKNSVWPAVNSGSGASSSSAMLYYVPWLMHCTKTSVVTEYKKIKLHILI
jgi:hypothetical protein